MQLGDHVLSSRDERVKWIPTWLKGAFQVNRLFIWPTFTFAQNSPEIKHIHLIVTNKRWWFIEGVCLANVYKQMHILGFDVNLWLQLLVWKMCVYGIPWRQSLYKNVYIMRVMRPYENCNIISAWIFQITVCGKWCFGRFRD